MSDLIRRQDLYNEINKLEELARNRVIDTPTNSPAYVRYVTQLNERTALKHIIADTPVAYDVDKVVERLEELHNYACFPADWVSEEQEPVYKYFREKLTEILKTIKAGGVNG